MSESEREAKELFKNKRSRSEEHPSCVSPGLGPASDSKISGVVGSKESKRKAKAEQEGSDLRGENLGLVMEGGETSSPVGTPESRKRSEALRKDERGNQSLILKRMSTIYRCRTQASPGVGQRSL